jgi:DNA-binding transcriptional ArsR family regulator
LDKVVHKILFEVNEFEFIMSASQRTPLSTTSRSRRKKKKRSRNRATRLRIFEAISATDRMNCGEIVSMRGVTPATVSHHLKILSEAKLIMCRREGQFVYNQAVP